MSSGATDGCSEIVSILKSVNNGQHANKIDEAVASTPIAPKLVSYRDRYEDHGLSFSTSRNQKTRVIVPPSPETVNMLER